MKKRVLSLLLALVMVLGMLPTAALAVDDTELAPVLRIGEGSKEREVTATALTSYTIGEDEKTPEGGIYKTALPTDAKSICIDIEGMYAISDPLTEGAEASTFNKYDEAVYTYPEGDATAAVKTAFGAENLTDVVTEDARLRMLEIYETEEDCTNQTPYITVLVEYSIERPKVTVSASEDSGAELVMNSETLALPYQFWCEGNSTWTSDTKGLSSGTIAIGTWNSDEYAFAGWSINENDPVGLAEDGTAESVRYGTYDSQDYADYFFDQNDTDGKGAYTLRFSQNYSTKRWEFNWQIYNGAGLIQNMTVEPVFDEKTPMQYTPTLVETDGGDVARVRIGETEEHTLSATADDGWFFDHWEQSTDGATWTTIEGAAECNVTLTEDTSYKAVFKKFAITELKVKNYALTGEGSDWFLNLDVELNAPLRSTTAFTINVYEGADTSGTKLGSASVNGYSGNQELTLKAAGLTRPSTSTAAIYVTAELPNKESANDAYTLVGTLDVEPDSFAVDSVAALFLHTEPDSYQLTVTGDPMPELEQITYSGSSGGGQGMTQNAAWIDETGKVSFTRFYNAASGSNTEFIADAGDGRIAVSTGSFKNGANAIKLSEDTVKVAAGTEQAFTPEKSSAAATAFRTTNTTATSSADSIFTASITTKSQGSYKDIVDQIVIHGVSAGEGELTLKVGEAEWTCKVIITSPETAVESVSLTPETADILTGETVALQAEITPATAGATLWWTSSDRAVATVDEDGVVTGKGDGTAVITVTAKDGLGKTVTDTCTVTVTDQPYQVKVYVPKTVVAEDGLKFYPTTGFNSKNQDIFDTAQAISYEKNTDNAEYDVYALSLKQGTYSFRAVDGSGKSLGGGCFQIPAEKNGGGTEDRDNTPIYLRKVEAYILNTTGEDVKASSGDFSVEMSNKLGALTLGDAYTNADGYDCYPALAYVNGNALLYYTNFTPSAEYAAANSVGSIMHANNAIMRGTGTETVKITLPTTATFTINAPKGADVSVYDQLKNYNTIRIDWSTTQEQADGTVDYIFNIAKKNTMSYRVSMEGKRTQVGFFSNAFGPAINVEDRIVVDFGDGSPTEQDSSGKYSGESSLLLNLNERNKLNLAVGESYKVRGYRAAWQIVNDVSANIMIEPDFHYTVLSGEDVIDITPTTGGNAKDNWAWVTAKKPGVAIVEVTYDALDRTIKDSKTLYGASDPNRTGVFVVTVGDQYGDIGGMKWDAEYNEVYFTQEQGSLSITPMGENVTVAVASVLNGRMSGWTTVAGSNGTFEVPVQSGNNVLRITANGVTDYRVVRGSKVTPVITIEGVEGRTEVYPGDTIKIGLKGIYQPMAKFSGIYNPGFPSNMSLGYKLDETDVRSGTTQYGLIEQQVTVEVPSDAQGSITLTNGKITGDSLGSNWGAHRVLTDIGVGANFNASRLDLESLSLPDLTIAVARLSDDEYKAEAKKVVSDAFANYDESKYTAENWQKIIAAKDAGLAAIDAAETMSAVTEAKNTALTAMAKVARISSGSSGSSGTDKTHTKSYYKTTGLDFDLTGEEIDGYVTISFEDYGKRLNDADFETPLGVLIEPTQVPYEKGDSIAKVTVRLLDALDIGYTYTGTVENAFYLATLENFKLSDGTVVDSFGEFDSGAGSGWMITLNNWFINRSTADFDVEDGDYIKWQNTCQIGADIGCDWNNPSAEIIGLKFGTSGTLSPAFDTSVTHYIYTVSASTKFVKLEAELENYWSILTCTSEGVSYKPMQEIPVENGTVIYLESAFAEYAGDPASDTDKVTITIQLRGSAAVSTPTDANEEDQKAADSVIALIDEIGTVTKDSGEKIDAARTAYNKLTDAQKELVSNYSKLTAAEKEFAKLTSRLPFTDVEGHWALEAIEYAYVNDLMSGTSATVFAPDATLNRAMLATILYRLEGKPAVQTKNTYTDVAAGTWYTDAVIWASENGIVTGYGNGKFGPTDNITREQMAVMLYRYAAYKNYDVTNASDLQGFIDMQSISAWALNAIKWANAEKLINGRTAQTIVPGGNATRAEAAAILMRFRENIAK